MTQDVIDELNRSEQEPSSFCNTLLEHTRALVKMSRTQMSQHYRDWDRQDEVYRGYRTLDKEDVEQAQKDKPVKMVVPNTFAQVMTFASFLFLLFKQNRTFFELQPTGSEDYGYKEEDCELLLERDLRHNIFDVVLFQHLLDVGRFGPSIIETCWTRDTVHAYVSPEPKVINYQGIQATTRAGSAWQEFVKYEGNLVRNVSPYRWFPDTRFPLSDFQRGEFCAAEEEYSMSQLRRLSAAGEVAGIDNIRPLSANFEATRGGQVRWSWQSAGSEHTKISDWLFSPSKSEGIVLVTKVQAWLTPSKFTYGPGGNKKLGPEEFPILYHLWYANDNTVIRCEPAYWWHNKFGWSLSQFTPDMHHTVTFGLADLIYRLQDVISWHINSRITDVRRNMRGRLVVDPGGVETTSLDGDGDIYLRSNASKSDVRRWVTQLDTRDVTAGHLNDAEILGKIMQVVTGVNDNIMGQYNQGRRSAQEARTVLSGAAGRMKLHGSLIWATGLAPLGQMMLSNLRQSLSPEVFMRVIGGDPNEAQLRYQAFKGLPEEVVMGDDYFTFDSTLQSEKGFMAQSLQDLLTAILQSDPSAAAHMTRNINPAKIMEEIQYLRGSGNIERFNYTPEEQAAIQQEQQMRLQAELASKQPKVNLSLSGKLTPEQEAQAATAALGTPQRAGLPQGAAGQQIGGNGS